ncbi:nucleotidyltransferase domain-containing protein [Candidatus Nanohalococcus occultus]|uniref:Minimal nucleotidyltransferase n=1 Tax=Candidatus Nanohalococcus occultus TaxID=2978047 RepID=A0ABY8CDU6_9ARCH|nr:Minimal nucleotidyltransferase [Candidatus Nanohaloarchaeota archaeon SVXNc]
MIKDLTKTEREVLDYFVRMPEEIHVRGLSKKIEVPYSSTRSALNGLEEKGFLESNKESKMTFYYPTEQRFRKAKKVLNLEKLEQSKVSEFLEKELKPEAVVLFGSYLDGRDRAESDIDIAVIGGREKRLDLTSFEKELGRKIQLTRIEDLGNENEEFKNTLANGMVLAGYLDVTS